MNKIKTLISFLYSKTSQITVSKAKSGMTVYDVKAIQDNLDKVQALCTAANWYCTHRQASHFNGKPTRENYWTGRTIVSTEEEALRDFCPDE